MYRDNFGHCRGCGAQIIWVRTKAGRNMPCNPLIVMYWAKTGAPGKVVTPDGEIVSCEFDGELDKATGSGYIAHWASCPKADELKRAKRAKA